MSKTVNLQQEPGLNTAKVVVANVAFYSTEHVFRFVLLLDVLLLVL